MSMPAQTDKHMRDVKMILRCLRVGQKVDLEALRMTFTRNGKDSW